MFAKLGSPEIVGQFVLGLAVAEPVMAFANLQLRIVLATDSKHEFAFGAYLSLRLVTSAFAFLLITAIVLAVGYRRETALVIVAVGFAKAIDSISDLLYGLLQRYERMDRIAKSMIIKGLMALTFSSIVFYFTANLFWSIVGLALAWLLVLVGYDAKNAAWVQKTAIRRQSDAGLDMTGLTAVLRPRWEKSMLQKLLWSALPLGFVMLLTSVNANAIRYFIDRYLGERELGIFGALAYFMLIGFTLVRALGQVASPRLAKYYATGNAMAFRKLLLGLVACGGLLGTIGVLVVSSAGQLVLTLFYQPEYAEYVDVFFWLMAASGVSYIASFLGYAVTATRQFGRLVIPPAVVIVITIGLSTIFIPYYGLIGAAWTACAASSANCLMLLILLTSARAPLPATRLLR